MGIRFLITGSFASSNLIAATVVSIVYIGAMMLAGGVLALFQAFALSGHSCLPLLSSRRERAWSPSGRPQDARLKRSAAQLSRSETIVLKGETVSVLPTSVQRVEPCSLLRPKLDHPGRYRARRRGGSITFCANWTNQRLFQSRVDPNCQDRKCRRHCGGKQARGAMRVLQAASSRPLDATGNGSNLVRPTS